MWFLGLVLGLLAGGVSLGSGGAVVGGLVGAWLTHMLGRFLFRSSDANAAETRLKAVEAQVAWLHRETQLLRAEIEVLRAGAPAAPAPLAGAPAAAAEADTKPSAAPGVAPTTALEAGREALSPTAARAQIVVDANAVAAHPAGTPEPLHASPEAAVGEELQGALASGAVAAAPTPAAAAAKDATVPPAAAARRPTATRPSVEARIDSAPAAATESLWQRLVGGNLVAKAGVVILFFGIAFLLKYAYERALLPPELRLAGVAAAGFAMLWLGRRLLPGRRLYGMILQGGGVGVLYLDVFFALKIFNLLGPVTAFVLFLALGVGTVLGAVRQDARPLATLGLIGAFLAPPLASRGGGSHVLLFSYYLLLNGFILSVSWFKAWRELNLTGFLFTFVISVAWGANAYQPAHFASVEPFLIAFFVMYLVIPMLFAWRQPPELKGVVDGTLVFGTPMAVAFLQAQLVRGMGDDALAWSAAVGAALYAALAGVAWRGTWSRLLAETYVALAVVLATLAIFFAFDAFPTFALWTLEGAAVLWVGLRQPRPLVRAFGMALQFLGAAYFLVKYPVYTLANPFFNDFTVGCGLIVVAALISGRLLWRYRESIGATELEFGRLFVWWAATWWFAGSLHAMRHGLDDARLLAAAALLHAAVSFAAVELAACRFAWPPLRQLTMATVPVLVVGALVMLAQRGAHPLGDLGYLAWPAILGVHFWCLRRQEADGVASAHGVRYLTGWVLLSFLGSWEAVWLLQNRLFAGALAWSLLGFGVAALRFRWREQGRAEAAPVSRLALAWAWVVFLAAATGQAELSFMPGYGLGALFGCVAAACVAAEFAGSRLGWSDLRWSSLLLFPAMLLTLLALYGAHLGPLHGHGIWAWPLAFAALYLNLWRQERDSIAPRAGLQHAVALWLLCFVSSWELQRLALQWAAGQSGWQGAAIGLPTAVLLIVVSRQALGGAWPIGRHAGSYLRLGLMPLAGWAALWSVSANLARSGAAAPLPHLPLLNPLDLTQAAMLVGLWHWWRGLAMIGDARRDLVHGQAILAGLGFVWLNGIVLRAVHHWGAVAFDLSSLLHSVVAQSALALLWSVTALALMRVATAQSRRTLWLVGAGLLAAVVLKLFFVDLGNSGTVARIVSFIGVGVLLLVIGYLAPVPPGSAEKQDG